MKPFLSIIVAPGFVAHAANDAENAPAPEDLLAVAREKSYADRMKPGFRFIRGGLVQDGVVLVPGPMIYEWGHADVDVERDGKIVHSAGNDLTVWKRDASGTWQISRNLAM